MNHGIMVTGTVNTCGKKHSISKKHYIANISMPAWKIGKRDYFGIISIFIITATFIFVVNVIIVFASEN